MRLKLFFIFLFTLTALALPTFARADSIFFRVEKEESCHSSSEMCYTHNLNGNYFVFVDKLGEFKDVARLIEENGYYHLGLGFNEKVDNTPGLILSPKFRIGFDKKDFVLVRAELCGVYKDELRWRAFVQGKDIMDKNRACFLLNPIYTPFKLGSSRVGLETEVEWWEGKPADFMAGPAIEIPYKNLTFHLSTMVGDGGLDVRLWTNVVIK